MNFAILGPGIVGEYHRKAIEANSHLEARLTAVGHHDPSRFRSIRHAYGVPCYSFETLLDRDDVDTVCICTPSDQHAEQTIAAARAGKHVLVEKPMALSLDDADRMIRACEDAKVNLGVVYQRRAEPLFQNILRAVQIADFGEMRTAVISMPYSRPQSYYDAAAWRGTWSQDGGGVLMNQGIHLIDLLIWYLGEPVFIQAYASTLSRNIEVEDTLAALLTFRNGAQATVSATTTAAPGHPHRFELYGTLGGIQIEGERVIRCQYVNEAVPQIPFAVSASPTTAGAASSPRGIAVTAHARIVRQFIQATRAGRSPLITGTEGRRSLATVLAIYKAAGLT